MACEVSESAPWIGGAFVLLVKRRESEAIAFIPDLNTWGQNGLLYTP